MREACFERKAYGAGKTHEDEGRGHFGAARIHEIGLRGPVRTMKRSRKEYA